MKFNLILANTKRSKTYIKELIKHNLIPNEVIFFSNKNNYEILNLCKKCSSKYTLFKTKDINNKLLEKYIINSNNNNFIYSGYPGIVIKSKIIKKNIIHVHPGDLYNFKGSTTIYYSLILKRVVTCSIIRLNKNIDQGRILYKKKFFPKKKITLRKLEQKYDDFVRIETLIEYLKNKKKINFKTTKNLKKDHYYICHPFLRHLAINKL